ncbi:MAG: hypothetical protein JWN44_6263 [Myxococcales bacterium]|nr:hypothetical protein [Myxococcales bacterium]
MLAVAALLASGCIAHRSAAFRAPAEPFGDLSDQLISDLLADGDRAWQKRQDPKQLDEAARAYGAALRYRPSDAAILVRLARVALRRAGLGGAVIARYEEATSFAERAMAARNAKLREAAQSGKGPEQIFSYAEPADAPALTLYAEALLGWAIANGTSTLLDRRPWIIVASVRALGFDRSIGWAAPDRVLGILDCEMPEARQNLRDALEHFEAAVAAAPAYLPTRIAYAEEYATRVRDAALYRRLLDEVIAADANALPEAAPENLDAQKAARSLIRNRY